MIPTNRTYLALVFALCCLVWNPHLSQGYQVQATSPAFGPKVVRWNVSPIPIFLHQDGAPGVTDGSDIRALKAAFQLWEAPTCNNLKFDIQLTDITVYSGRKQDPGDPFSPAMKDGKSVVRFETKDWEFGEGTLATGATFFTPDTGQIQEADMLFNAINFKWSDNEAPGTIDIITVALQRIGYMLGLRDSEIRGSVMHPDFDLRRVDRTLRQDDIDGSCFLYPTSGWTDKPPPGPKEPGTTPNEPPPTTTENVTNPDGGNNNPSPDTNVVQPLPDTNTGGGCSGCHHGGRHGDEWILLIALCVIFLLANVRRSSVRSRR